MKNIITKNIKSKKDFELIDNQINKETERKIKAVKGSEYFGISTACYIDDEFVCVTNYEISNEMYERLKNA